MKLCARLNPCAFVLYISISAEFKKIYANECKQGGIPQHNWIMETSQESQRQEEELYETLEMLINEVKERKIILFPPVLWY